MRTSTGSSALTRESVTAALRTKTYGRSLHLLQQTGSTNTVALELAQQGAPHGTLVVAEQQTAGRGRLGRQWYSPPGDNLYCSLLLRLPANEGLPSWLSWIPLASASGSARGVERVTGLRLSLKWPNDLLVGARKVGGLLCESTVSAQGTCVVVGIGLNVNTPQNAFPEDLQPIATSLAAETGRPHDRAAVLAALLLELEARLESLLAGAVEPLRREYMSLCTTLDRRVRVTLTGGTVIEGLAEAIGPDGSLQVLQEVPPCAHGERKVVDIRAGDVVHLR
jgi:BirA family biotin operon repressor/biotin-[acetyl-CoA-carboxylase] ligase